MNNRRHGLNEGKKADQYRGADKAYLGSDKSFEGHPPVERSGGGESFRAWVSTKGSLAEWIIQAFSSTETVRRTYMPSMETVPSDDCDSASVVRATGSRQERVPALMRRCTEEGQPGLRKDLRFEPALGNVYTRVCMHIGLLDETCRFITCFYEVVENLIKA